MQGLPASPDHFSAKKVKILEQLSVPDADYSDLSPKGTVDEGIRDLIDKINAVDGFVTTSSCAGRVSVFVEGRRTAEVGDNGQVAGVGGKGAGGAWLFVSHDPVGDDDGWIKSLHLSSGGSSIESDASRPRFIHFKFEPMILHVLTASPAHAQLLLRCALQAGFRESGAVNLTAATDQQPSPMVAVRSMGLGFESLVGRQVGDDVRELLVPEEYLHALMSIANERFIENEKRIARFQEALTGAIQADQGTRTKPDGTEWEDAAARKERKRAEGLRRRAELQREGPRHAAEDGDGDAENTFLAF